MDLQIKSRHAEISGDLEKYVEKKINKLMKLNIRIMDATVMFEENATKSKKDSHRVEMILHAPGTIYKTEEKDTSFYAAVDKAVDKLKRQLRKQKTKQLDKNQNHLSVAEVEAMNGKIEPLEMVDSDADKEPAIITETYSARPITVADAIAEFTMENMQYGLFVNDRGEVNGLYRRNDGGYILLVPED